MNLLVLGMLTFAVFIFAFTQVFGRLWCGWACPQTIFMEWIFRPIEILIEGNSAARLKLDNGKNDFNKIFKKSLKVIIFWVVSFGLANVFLAYLIGKKELFKIISEPPSQHLGGLFALLVFTTIFFFVYLRLRELACILICPYGRLQGTLQDKSSLTVIYDFIRGEPRGHVKKGAEKELGDCIDCNWCVTVCPTGIDIRNGPQMECIQCTECVDACDQVMEKIGKPKNLIGYFSENQILEKKPFQIDLKGYGYFALWFILASLLGTLLYLRTPIESVILRTPGNTGLSPMPGQIANLYNFEMINKTFVNQHITIKSLDKNVEIEMVGNNQLDILPQQSQKGSFFLKRMIQDDVSHREKIKLQILTNGEINNVVETQFFYIPKPKAE